MNIFLICASVGQILQESGKSNQAATNIQKSEVGNSKGTPTPTDHEGEKESDKEAVLDCFFTSSLDTKEQKD